MPKIKKIEMSFVCDEDWTKMAPVSSGRHCSSCEKTVVDFTGMSDAQIVAYYSQKTNEKTCGQFRHGQLDHVNKGLALPTRKVNRSWFKPVLASALLASFGCETKSEKVVPKVEIEKENPDQVDDDLVGVICVDTNKTSNSKSDFQPRKISRVQSLDSPLIQQKAVEPPPIIIEIPYHEHVLGLPAIHPDDEINIRGEVQVKGKIKVTDTIQK